MNQNNGLVDLLSPMPNFNISTYKSKSVDNRSFYVEATSHNLTRTQVSDLFFSKENIDAIQEGIRYSVYQRTNNQYTIGRQSDQSLKTIMRSIYLQFSKNIPFNIIGQVRELNSQVLEWSVQDIVSNLTQYQGYRYDISKLPIPLDYGAKFTQKGSKQLEFQSTII